MVKFQALFQGIDVSLCHISHSMLSRTIELLVRKVSQPAGDRSHWQDQPSLQTSELSRERVGSIKREQAPYLRS